MLERRSDGHFVVRLDEEEGRVLRVLGRWWITAALQNKINRLPLVNV